MEEMCAEEALNERSGCRRRGLTGIVVRSITLEARGVFKCRIFHDPLDASPEFHASECSVPELGEEDPEAERAFQTTVDEVVSGPSFNRLAAWLHGGRGAGGGETGD
jgi:hypothetical protein